MSRFTSDLYARALRAIGKPDTLPSTLAMTDPADDAEAMATAMVMRFEGFRPTPYLCPAGVPTVGYGSTYYADGRRVTLTDPPISQEAAERLVTLELRRTFMPAVIAACPVPMTPGRMAALTDWTYNLGGGALMASTLRRRINEGRWDEVPTQLRRWVYAGGARLRGLVIRRDAEAAMI